MSAMLHRRAFYALGLALIGCAWLILWVWASSPYARFLDHADWTRIGLLGSVCRALPLGQSLVPALLYATGWVLMLAAMMLPTTLPLLQIFARLTRRRPDRAGLMALVILGYLLAWSAFGLAAHLADYALAASVGRVDWLVLNGWAVGAAILALAGLFQFSDLKRRCLDKCRMPMSFVIAHWRGGADRRRALELGWWHGVFCVGCCWAIMLIMFVVGTGNLGWMLLLGAIMAIEKNFRWGRRISTPLGILLLCWSGGMILVHGLPLSVL